VKVSVIDLGVNNIRSVVGALEHLGVPAAVVRQPVDLDGLCLLPGIGNFGFVSRLMHDSGWMESVRRHAKGGGPVIGICLGMQLLLEASAEAPGESGLGLLPGQVIEVASLPVGSERLPVTGWRKLHSDAPALAGPAMYFNHSYGLPADHPACMASYSYGQAHIAAIVGKANVMGLQFHPEKSGLAGLHLLKRCIDQVSLGKP